MSVLSASSRSTSNESLNDENECDLKNEDDISVEAKFAINIVLNKFFLSSDIKEYEFPSSLSSNERSYIHRLCRMNDFNSIAKGKGSKKTLIISKKNEYELHENEPTLTISSEARQMIEKSKDVIEILPNEREELLSRIQKSNSNFPNPVFRDINKFENIIPKVPKKSKSKISGFMDKLPTRLCKGEILTAINLNRLVYIAGETGIGKTSQIGQFLLETEQKRRIILSQPSDLIASYTANLIAKLRNEDIGETVGYQTSLNNRMSENTIITVCTHEILLKNLIQTNDSTLLNSITHFIVDEIQLRDKYCDLILVLVKEILVKYKFVKFVLIGVSTSNDFFQKYFNHCPIIIVPSFTKNIQDFYLEDILKDLDKSNELLAENDVQNHIYLLESWCVDKMKNLFYTDQTHNLVFDESTLLKSVDDLIEKSWIYPKKQYFEELLNLIETKKLAVNYQHSKTKVTVLMSASISGFYSYVEKSLKLGANPWIKSCNDLIALEWAKRFTKNDVIELLECHTKSDSIRNLMISEFMIEKDYIIKNNSKLDDHALLKAYYEKSTSDYGINFDIIGLILKKILKSNNEGSVLIFLPDLQEITNLHDYLKKEEFLGEFEVQIKMIYSEMQPDELNECLELDDMFGPSLHKFKIILTDEICESSISFGNVIAVIDTGLVQQKTFDSETNLIIKKNIWITKSCVNIRRNKVGFSKSSQCYHLYSKYRFKNMQSFSLAHILTDPTQDICMLAKLIVPFNTSIADLISKAPDSPAFLQLRNSINYLKTIDALDTWEDMTDLGAHLINMPIDLNLAKMILFSIAMKCLDPVLVIACSLSYEEPCNLIERTNSSNYRDKLDNCAYSDHIVLYKIYREWSKARDMNEEKSFCEENGLNSTFLYRIEFLRYVIISYLRRIGLIKLAGSEGLKDLNQNFNNIHCIKAALIAGRYPHLIQIDKKNNRLVTKKSDENKIKVKISLDSVVSSIFDGENFENIEHDWIIYDEMFQEGNLHYIKRCTLVSSLAVSLFAGQLKTSEHILKETEASFKVDETNKELTTNYKIDNWINFKVDKKDGYFVFLMRQNFNLLVLKCIKYKDGVRSSEVLELLVNILEMEGKASDSDQKLLQFDNNLVDFSLTISPHDKENGVQFIVLTSMSENEFRSYESKMNLSAEVFWNKDIIRDYFKRKNATRALIEFINTKDQKPIGKSELSPNPKRNSLFTLKVL